MKMMKLVLTTATAVAILSLGACSGIKPLYTNEVYNDAYKLDDVSFNIDMTIPVFDDKFDTLNRALQERKNEYLRDYREECESTYQMYQAEYGLPDNMGFRISSEVESDGNTITVVIRNEYYLAGAAHDHVEVTTLRYDTETDNVVKEERILDGQEIEI